MDKAKRRRRCARCRKLKPVDQVPVRENPYAAEIDDDHAKMPLCDDCHEALADDV